MRDLNKLFKYRRLDKDKLIKYGFIDVNGILTFKKDIENTNFQIIVSIENDNYSSIIIDTSFNDEFILVDVNEEVGQFVASIRTQYDNLLADIYKNCSIEEIFKNENTKLAIEYIKGKYNKRLEFLWDDTPDCAITRNQFNSAWFALFMIIDISKLDNTKTGSVEILNIRYPKGKTTNIVNNKSIFKAYHMNKNSWISIMLNEIDITTLKQLIDKSYLLSIESKPTKNIGFYFKGNLDRKPILSEYTKVNNIYEAYFYLNKAWSVETCAPRLRHLFNEENNTAGQCSITAFLIQDIFGGKVYGILNDDNFSYHCFNVFDDLVIDFTCRQFGDRKLNYKKCVLQSREVHLQTKEKYDRYLLLRSRFNELINK